MCSGESRLAIVHLKTLFLNYFWKYVSSLTFSIQYVDFVDPIFDYQKLQNVGTSTRALNNKKNNYINCFTLFLHKLFGFAGVYFSVLFHCSFTILTSISSCFDVQSRYCFSWLLSWDVDHLYNDYCSYGMVLNLICLRFYPRVLYELKLNVLKNLNRSYIALSSSSICRTIYVSCHFFLTHLLKEVLPYPFLKWTGSLLRLFANFIFADLARTFYVAFYYRYSLTLWI